jgi:hypothetical protein
VTYAELARALRRHGCELKRQSKDSHEIWIAKHPVLSKATHVSCLPPEWGTLYELTKLDDAILERALAEGRIHPDLQRDVAALHGAPVPQEVSHREDVGTVADVLPRVRRYIQTLTVQHPLLVRVLPRPWIRSAPRGSVAP